MIDAEKLELVMVSFIKKAGFYPSTVFIPTCLEHSAENRNRNQN